MLLSAPIRVGIHVLRWLLLALLLVGPLAALIAANLTTLSLHTLVAERARLGTLLATTLGLAGIATLIAVPVGTLLGVILERLPLRGHGAAQFLVILGLFVPLPVTAIAWQIVLGTWLPPLTLNPGDIAWRPWNQGLLPAAFVHAMAALPWVTVIVQVILRHVDRGLEEEALVNGGPNAVFRHVLLPKLLLAMLAGFAWVTVQAFTEIPVTDAMMVRTLAEEVYTQIVGVPEGVAAAVTLTLAVLFAAFFIVIAGMNAIIRRWPVSPEPLTPSRILPFANRNRNSIVAWFIIAIALGLPLVALVWKAGGGGATDGGSLTFALNQIRRVIALNGTVLVITMLTAIAAGIITATIATALCWWAQDSHFRRLVVTALAVILALSPGPLLGFGLKQMIFRLIDAEAAILNLLGVTMEFPPLKSALYDQPSPLPYLWACILRYFAVAVIVVAPVIRSLPRDLVELARQDGVSVWHGVGRPLVLRASLLAALAVAGLSLGEVSAGKLVLPPGCRMFILDLFDQMHYGAESTVAAMAVVQVVLAVPVVMFLRWQLRRGWNSECSPFAGRVT